MWKGPTLDMQQKYPFGELSEPATAPKHLVRKQIPKNDRQLEKARTQAHLKHDCLIKLQSAQEENGQYFLLFEYVHTPLDKWFVSVSRQFIQNYEQRLILFSRYLADRNIITSFQKQNMGVTECGDAKYFLDPLFSVDQGVDRLGLKKKYKQEIREVLQYYIDRKAVQKNQGHHKQPIPDKKQNPKLQKILEAIEKGKANLCSQQNKQTALVSQQNQLSQNKQNMKPIKGIQKFFIEKQINQVNKIQVMVGNKPVEVLQQQYKKEFASSSFYVNGVPTVVVERQGQAKRLFSPNDKFARFQEVKFKEYKSLKKSGQIYVQDFINVLEADDTQKLGSPRATFKGPKLTLLNSPKANKERPEMTSQLAIEPEDKKTQKKLNLKNKQSIAQHLKISSPRAPRQNAFISEKGIRSPGTDLKNMGDPKGAVPSHKANDLQKKVSQAIANSLNAISKFKSAKNQG